MLAFPIFATQPDGEEFVSLLVYADSQRPEFFDSDWSVDQGSQRKWSSCLTRLFHATDGFVDSCDQLYQKKVIRFATSSFWGVPPEPTAKDLGLIKKFGKKGALFMVKDRIEGYEKLHRLTAKVPLHWDCFYRNHELLSDDSLRA
jgi:hypothetical protein